MDESGNAYLTGYTFSTDFPIAKAFDRMQSGLSFDAFVTKIGAPVSNAALIAVSDSFLRSGADDTNWNGGTFAIATAAGVLHTNGLLGEVSWDVTSDMLAGAGFGWLIKKQQEGP